MKELFELDLSDPKYDFSSDAGKFKSELLESLKKLNKEQRPGVVELDFDELEYVTAAGDQYSGKRPERKDERPQR